MVRKIVRVPVRPEVLRWARERVGRDVESLQKAFPKLAEWERGEIHPTIRQLEDFARITRVPFGYFFLDAPPDEPLPIPDFRIMPRAARPPSPDLLDTIYICQQRQEWYRGYLQTLGEEPPPFVGSASLADDADQVAARIRDRLNFDLEERRRLPTWKETLRRFIEQIESAGVLVMASGIVGSNTRRKLDPEEFRGFTLVDDLAPLIFVNGSDTKSAQMFTLAHELAHIWLGESGVSDPEIITFLDKGTEHWCNQVAAELLVPMRVLQKTLDLKADLKHELNRMARIFKVSTLVILRRVYEMGLLEEEELWAIYREEVERLKWFERRDMPGGDFYRTLKVRVSKTFVQAVVANTLEGHTLFRDAYQMLGIRSPETFQKLVRSLGVG